MFRHQPFGQRLVRTQITSGFGSSYLGWGITLTDNKLAVYLPALWVRMKKHLTCLPSEGISL